MLTTGKKWRIRQHVHLPNKQRNSSVTFTPCPWVWKGLNLTHKRRNTSFLRKAFRRLESSSSLVCRPHHARWWLGSLDSNVPLLPHHITTFELNSDPVKHQSLRCFGICTQSQNICLIAEVVILAKKKGKGKWNPEREKKAGTAVSGGPRQACKRCPPVSAHKEKLA